MIRENKMKQGLKEGKNYIGTFSKIIDPCVVELFSMIGFDFFIIDNEHTQMSKESMVNLLRTSDISGIVPIVRIRENSRAQVLQALDGGSLGIMVPETSTREEVQFVVDNTKYGPLGKRGYTPSSRAAGYGFMNASEYALKANENTMIVVYCETAKGIENIEEMLNVKGIDVMFIGPMDLSQALGVTGQSKHPLVVEAMKNIIEKAKAAGIAVGTIAPDAKEAQRLMDMGVQVIGLSSDQGMIAYAGKQFMKELGR
ncbi:MAG TPA: aldolase/citrate lyase family protein [Ruminiclostridium sp.]